MPILKDIKNFEITGSEPTRDDYYFAMFNSKGIPVRLGHAALSVMDISMKVPVNFSYFDDYNGTMLSYLFLFLNLAGVSSESFPRVPQISGLKRFFKWLLG